MSQASLFNPFVFCFWGFCRVSAGKPPNQSNPNIAMQLSIKTSHKTQKPKNQRFEQTSFGPISWPFVNIGLNIYRVFLFVDLQPRQCSDCTYTGFLVQWIPAHICDIFGFLQPWWHTKSCTSIQIAIFDRWTMHTGCRMVHHFPSIVLTDNARGSATVLV